MFLDFNLLELYPFIAKEFDHSKNNEITIENLALDYNKQIWWICDRNHSWQATLQERIGGKNCPICSNIRLLRGKNDLLTTHPELVKEWDYERNGDLKPDDVTEGSPRRVHWICSVCGNRWITAVRCRTTRKKTGCNLCARRKVWQNRYKELLKTRGCIIDPKLIQDWDYEANFPLKPSDFTPSSNKIVWWKCHTCNYKFKDRIASRSKSLYCPVCTNRVIIPGYNDLQTTHPDIAKQWHPTKNGKLKPTDISHGNGKKVWWICPIGHEYQAIILNRTKDNDNGNGCPVCDARRHTSFAEQAVFYYIKKFFPDAINRFKADFLERFELDIYIPSRKVAIEYDGKAWHKENIYERELRKYKACRETGIKLIRLKEKELKPSDSTTCDIALHTMWKHEILNKTILEILSILQISCNDKEIDVTRDKFNITKLMDSEYMDSLGNKHPELVSQWHPTKNLPATPFMFACGTHVKAWWVCPDCGHEYEAAISSRTSGTGCPKCARHRFLYNKNKKVAKLDLKTNKTITIYNSITETAKDCGLRSSSNITSVCKGNKKSVGGYGWKYID